MCALLWLFDTLLSIVIFVIFASVVMSWLLAFNVVNMRNPIVNQIGSTLYQITEPIYRPIRNRLPRTGALDLAPLIVLIAVYFLRILVLHDLFRYSAVCR